MVYQVIYEAFRRVSLQDLSHYLFKVCARAKKEGVRAALMQVQPRTHRATRSSW